MFRLRKHYFDGIDPAGNALIAYAAELHCHGLALPYSALILSPAEGRTIERSCLRTAQLFPSGIRQPKLGFEGRWQALADGVRLALPAGSGQLAWHAHTPAARFQVALNGREYSGLGYAETLEMDFWPQRLPLRELYWGRFVSEGHYAVWIEWRGEVPLRRLVYNGTLAEDFMLEASGLSTPAFGLRLDFAAPQTIKDEPLLAIAERNPVLRLLFGRRFLSSREQKWKSRATLRLPENISVEGWALYERVLWQK
ncbi:hypothetical protein H9Q10_03440 [Eikenella sp. S3360]|uniref:Uncharacterized protein n=1 Tax=Eikenella glucosivorans TaxID=2766967 RepID=A0ABS0N8W7_9NEIS|nr:hypothetical protein [Eikenella glucosivorans]MBH5328720.1 hypothetical protein [Eikenella glucosivorans]